MNLEYLRNENTVIKKSCSAPNLKGRIQTANHFEECGRVNRLLKSTEDMLRDLDDKKIGCMSEQEIMIKACEI
jgi:hypothetical protein